MDQDQVVSLDIEEIKERVRRTLLQSNDPEGKMIEYIIIVLQH